MDLLRRRGMMGRGGEEKPIDDGYIWAYYDVIDTENATKLLGATNNLGTKMVVDGVEVDRATTYIFPTTGKHLVKFYQNTTSLGNSVIYDIPRLLEVYFPSKMSSMGNFGINKCLLLRKVHFFGSLNSAGTYSFGERCPIEELNWENYNIKNATGTMATFNGHRLIGNVVLNEGIVTPPGFTGTAPAPTQDLHLTLPSTVTNVLGYFANSCRNLVTVTVKATTPPTASQDMFGSCPRLTHIYVPSGSVEAYKSANRWSKHASKISAIIE